jgi:crotonobetainyl-CoA:carnitine CoA-transferase CaiB-like acyl-CoA transferase
MLLAGTRVLEWTTGLTGSYCARLLADLGAEVTKVEPPRRGDPLRHEGAVAPGQEYGESLIFAYLNHGKRSITLDPGLPAGAELFEQLVGEYDLLIETPLSAGTAGPHLDIATLRAKYPKLVILSLSPFGIPAGAVPSTPLTLQHRSSYAYHQAAPCIDPEAQRPVGCADREGPMAVGVSAASAAMWGLLVADGETAPHIDLASHDFYSAHLYPGNLAAWCIGEREFPRKRGSFGGTEVAGGLVWMLECADGWVMASPREQHQWERWMGLLGDPPWSKDKTLCGDREARKIHSAKLQTLMSECTLRFKRHDLYEAARRDRVACFPVNENRDLLQNQQLSHRKFFDQLEIHGDASVPMPGLPFRFVAGGEELPRGRTVASPALGEANEEIIGKRLGKSAAELEALANGTII